MSYSDLYKDGDNVYYNITIANNTNQVINARYDETRNDIIICDPRDYYLTIVRFSVPLNSIPIMIMPMDGLSITDSVFKVTLTYIPTGDNYQETVIYQPDNNLAPTDPNYFYIYTYTKLLEMVNIAFATAFSALKS